MNFINALLAWLVVFTACVVQIAQAPPAANNAIAGMGIAAAILGWIWAFCAYDS